MLARIETALFAAPDFTPLHSVSELAMHPHVRFSAIPLEAPLRLVSGQNTLDVKVNTVFRANTSEALRQAIESGLGIGGMQLPLAARAVQSGRLVPVLPAWRLPDRFLYAVYPDARFIPRGSEALSAPSNPYCLTLRAISEGETFALGKSERETVEAECEEN